MVAIDVRETGIELEEPVLVDGLPGVGLVGKIATDHVIERRGMTYYADVTPDGAGAPVRRGAPVAGRPERGRHLSGAGGRWCVIDWWKTSRHIRATRTKAGSRISPSRLN